MTSAADLIDSLLARRRAHVPLERATRLPYGWAMWMRGQPAAQGSDKSKALTAALAARPRPLREPAPPPLGFWRAFYRLWWQHDQPAPRDQRWMRWVAALISFLLHVLFALLLVWVAVVRWTPMTPSGGDGGRTQVAFVGAGVADAGGGEQEGAGAAPDTTQEAARSSAAQAGGRAEPSASAATAMANSTDEVTPAPSPPADQPLQVTEVEQATHAFVLPPPRVQVRTVEPAVRMPEVQVQSREVTLTDPAPTLARTVPVPDVAARVPVTEVAVRERQLSLAEAAPVVSATLAVPAAPAIRQREVAVREREVQIAQAPAIEPPSITVADVSARVRTPEMAVREVQVPMASPGRQAQEQVQERAQLPDRAAASATPTPAPARQLMPTGQGSGWDATARDDNWATRGQSAAGAGTSGPGVFNADGSVRLANDGTGAGPADARGAPGGETDTWTRDRLAQSGTWLKRPPYDYTPTSFDKYWVPNESLLAEWVRKGVKSIAIRIPGTSTTLSCKISLLQLGGGCGLDNPNLQDQPASARPPPDVPFKRELQEDNGSR